MARPRSATDLSKPQRINYDKLISKEELTDKERETLTALQAKIEKFNNYPLSETAKKYLIGRFSKERYGKRVAAVNKMTPSIAKGTALEDEGMKFLSRIHNLQYYRPLECAQNDFLYGKCDVLCRDNDILVEIKTSWSAESFFPYQYNGLPKKVWLQAQAYLELYNLEICRVCYVLINTPKHLIDQEYANIFKRYTFGEISRELYEEGLEKIEGFYNYDNIPDKRRVIEFEVHRNRDIMIQVRKRAIICREWLAEFERKHVANKKIIPLPDKYIKYVEENNTESDPAEPHPSD